MTEDLPSQTKMEASGEKKLFCKYEHVFKCTFSRGKAGPGPLPGGVHVKIQMGMLIKCFQFEIWANLVFSGGGVGVENWAIFGLRKSSFKSFFKCTFHGRRKGWALAFTRGCNVTIQMGMLV